MIKFFIRWAINAIAIYAAVRIVPGIELGGDWTSFIWVALIFGLLNALLRPLLTLLTCPLILLTLGLFTIVINAGLLLLTSNIGQSFGLDFTIAGFWPAVLGSLVISVVSVLLSMILRDEPRRKTKKQG